MASMFRNPTEAAAVGLYRRQAESNQTGIFDPDVARRRAFMAAATEGLSEITELQEAIQRNRNALQNAEEGGLRAAAATRQAESEVQALYNLDWSEYGGTDFSQFIEARWGLGGREAYSLEQGMVDAAGDYASTGEDYVVPDNRDIELIRRDRMINLSYLETEMENSLQSRQARPWGWALFEFGAQAIPFWSTSTEGATGNLGDLIFPGEELRDRAREFNSMVEQPPEVFVPYFRQMVSELREQSTKFGYFDQSLFERTLASIGSNAPTIGETNLFAAMDNVPIIGAAANGARRAALTPIRAIVRQGSRQRGAELAAQSLETAIDEGLEAGLEIAGLRSKDDLLSSVSPRAFNPYGTVSEVSLAADINDQILNARQFLEDAVGGLPGTRRLNTSEADQAVQRATTRLENRVGRPVRDVETVEVPLSDGTFVRRTSAWVGRQDGQGFASEASAVRYADSIGLQGVEVRPDDSGQWFVKATLNVPETGAYRTNLDNRATIPFVSRLLLSSRANVDANLMAGGVVSANRRQRIVRDVVEPFQRQLSKLKDQEADALRNIWAVGNDRSQWFNRNQFNDMYERVTGARPSNRVWAAYRSAILMNDTEWVLRNDALYKDRVIRGMESVTFDGVISGNRVNGQVLDSLPSKEGLYDLSTNTYYRAGSRSELPDGYRIVRLEDPIRTPDGPKVRTIVAPENALRVEPLRTDQLNYRPGGHRMYQGDQFVKQARYETLPDGTTNWESPRTFIVGRTGAEVKGWAETMNRARQMVLDADNLDDPGLARRIDEEVFGGRAGFGTGKKFIEDVNAGRILLDEPFEVVPDRGLPSAYNRRNPADSDLVDEDKAGYDSWMGSQNGMYYGNRGDDALVDYQGEKAPVLDMFEMLNTSLRNIANLSSLTDYKNEALQRWAATFGKYVDVREGASPAEIFINGRLNPDTPSAVVESAEAARMSVRNILGWRGEEARHVDALTNRVIDTIAGENPGTFRSNLAASMKTWWNTSNPQGALTGAAFDMKLGLFNIAQFPLQISQMAAISALNPRHGASAWVNHLPAYTYFINGSDGILDNLIGRGFHKVAGFDDPEDYRSFMRYLREGGFTDVGGNQVLINEFGPSAAFGSAGGRARQIREGGRFFFYQAEVWNRIMAQHVSWKEVSERLGNISRSDPEFLRQVALRADDYAFNMIRETGAWWQRGALAIPTQFWSYSARMMEAMLTDKFPPAARWRLFLSQSALYGTTGIMGYNSAMWIKDKIFGTGTPEVPEPTELLSLRGLFERGLLDQIVYLLTGEDVRVGERYGTGDFIGAILRDVSGDGDYGEVSVAEFFGGASASIWYDVIARDALPLFQDVTTYFLAERGAEDVPFSGQSFRQLAMNISGLSNAMKAYMIHQHNIYVSSSGTILADDIPSGNAWAALLSYRPNEVAQMDDMFDYMQNRSEMIEELSREMVRYRQMMLADPENASDYAAQMYLLRRYNDPVIAHEAWMRATSDWDPSLLSSIEERISRLRVRDMGREIEVNENE